MDRKLMFSLMLLTVVVCCFFVVSNPVLSTDIDDLNFTKGDVFAPSDGHYDFGMFALNDSDASYYEVKAVEAGHVLIVDETGDKVINVFRFDDMINFKRDSSSEFIRSELSKTGWMVDGVEVHEIDFSKSDPLYSACTKDTSNGTLIYLATPSDRQTSSMINSLTFK